jgi:hypothetical protein
MKQRAARAMRVQRQIRSGHGSASLNGDVRSPDQPRMVQEVESVG